MVLLIFPEIYADVPTLSLKKKKYIYILSGISPSFTQSKYQYKKMHGHFDILCAGHHLFLLK